MYCSTVRTSTSVAPETYRTCPVFRRCQPFLASVRLYSRIHIPIGIAMDTYMPGTGGAAERIAVVLGAFFFLKDGPSDFRQ